MKPYNCKFRQLFIVNCRRLVIYGFVPASGREITDRKYHHKYIRHIGICMSLTLRKNIYVVFTDCGIFLLIEPGLGH